MIFAFSSAIGPVPINCFLRERHFSGVEITGNPIETGAEVHDHAYLLPKEVSLEIADENAVSALATLTRFQESRRPFTLVTGLQVYSNMMIRNIEAVQDSIHSRILKATVDLQEVIIVDTAYATGDAGSDTGVAGQPGGRGSTSQARPTPSRAGDALTADRVTGTIQRGDAPSLPVPLAGNSVDAVRNREMLRGLFG